MSKVTLPVDEPKPRIIPRWAAKGLMPVNVRRDGKLRPAVRRGKHACNRGSVVIRSPHIRVGL